MHLFKPAPVLAAALLLAPCSPAFADPGPSAPVTSPAESTPPAVTPTTAPTTASEAVPAVRPTGLGVYLHFGGGAGLALMSSDAITQLFGDGFGIEIGTHLSYSFSTGFRNQVQLEYRNGDSAHTLSSNNILTQQATEIPMDYDYSEYVGKVNLLLPSAENWKRRESALFVVVGTTKVKYLDKAKDGFKGTGTLLGMEYARFAPGGRACAAFGVRRYDIDFDRIILSGHSGRLALSARNWVFHTSISVGVGA
ncbi:MAG: hypothetical protein IT349_04905 [Candidatus Eisenbacteria bacterium]|nr:hypothetical protein [Candidatus Eisenbacteria bacterium]MCC7141422.1 hypothetical protein [Candidatus Eisenbacteria bacterium]